METRTVLVEVFCDAEKKLVGHLRLVPGARPKVLHAGLAWAAFEPADSKYKLAGKVSKGKRYWHCPHCQGHLCIDATVRTGERHPETGKAMPDPVDPMAPVVLGRTKIQVA